MAIAVDHQTIICVVGCNNIQSASLSISTTLSSPTEEQCDLRIPVQNTAEGIIKTVYMHHDSHNLIGRFHAKCRLIITPLFSNPRNTRG